MASPIEEGAKGSSSFLNQVNFINGETDFHKTQQLQSQ